MLGSDVVETFFRDRAKNFKKGASRNLDDDDDDIVVVDAGKSSMSTSVLKTHIIIEKLFLNS